MVFVLLVPFSCRAGFRGKAQKWAKDEDEEREWEVPTSPGVPRQELQSHWASQNCSCKGCKQGMAHDHKVPWEGLQLLTGAGISQFDGKLGELMNMDGKCEFLWYRDQGISYSNKALEMPQ